MKRLTLTDILMRAESRARSAVGSSMVKLRDQPEAEWASGIRADIAKCRKELDRAEAMLDSGNIVTVFARKVGR